MKTLNATRSRKAANDNLSPLKRALLEWSESDHGVRGNAKSFLRLLASHAAPDATVWILRKRFARILGVSVRSITTYTALLQAEGLMAKIGVEISGPCAMFDVYRLAPANDWIQSLTESGPVVDREEGRCNSNTERGNSFAAYREDTTDPSFRGNAAANRCPLSAETLKCVGPVPQEIREAWAAVLSPEQLISYVDSAYWTGPSVTLHTKTGYGAMWLKANDRGVARALGIRIVAHVEAVRHG